MDNYSIHTIVPQLRFPDFLNDKEWEVKRLGEVCRLTNGMAFKPSDWIETGIPIVRIQNLNDENAPFNYCAPEIIDDRCMIDTGTLLFSWSGTPGTSFGAFIWNRGKAVLNQHIFIVKPVEIDKVFLKMAIDANMTSIIEKSHGGAGLRHITKSDFEDIRISVPKDIAEQRCIATCLSALDEMLAATNEKLEQLKAYKKGLMQKLFPAKGKKLPELRFKEFEKDGEWEEKKLGEIVNVLDSQRKPVAKNERMRGKYPYYGANGIQDYVSDYIFDGSFLLMGEDGSVINKDGTPVLHWAEGRIWVNNHAHVMSENCNAAYLKYVFYVLSKVDVQSLVKGIPPKINQQNMRNILLLIPSLPEQEKIASCLSTLDEKINSYKEKIALLGQYKKGLMQQLFPTSK